MKSRAQALREQILTARLRNELTQAEALDLSMLLTQAPCEIVPDHTGPGTIYGYIRVSTADQVNEGMSLQAQGARMDGYALGIRERYGADLLSGPTFADAGISAFSRNLASRPKGMKLNGILKSGDHVIFTALDRGFRSVKDFLHTYDAWSRRGVTMHFMNMGLDLGTATGRLVATIIASVAEWESRIKSERVKEVKAWQKAQGAFSSVTPWGMIAIGHGPQRFVVPDWPKLLHVRYAQYLRFKGWFPRPAWDRLDALLAKRQGVKPRARGWRTTKVGSYTREKFLVYVWNGAERCRRIRAVYKITDQKPPPVNEELMEWLRQDALRMSCHTTKRNAEQKKLPSG